MMNKKGQLVDILGGIQRGISWFIDVVPKPVKTLIFLLFLLVFASVFGFLLNTTGHFCDSQGNLYKTGAFSFKTNFDLLTDMPSNKELTSTALDPDDPAVKATTIVNCNVLYGEGMYYINENDQTIPISPGTYYHTSERCVECDFVDALYNGTLGGELTKTTICLGDAHAIEYDDLSWFGKQTCGKTFGVCTPPSGYYYNKAEGAYVCDTPGCEGVTLGQLWNENLKDVGAKIITQEQIAEYDYRRAVSIQCDVGDVNPKFKLFNIEIFNYKLWIVLILLGAIGWVSLNLRRR